MPPSGHQNDMDARLMGATKGFEIGFRASRVESMSVPSISTAIRRTGGVTGFNLNKIPRRYRSGFCYKCARRSPTHRPKPGQLGETGYSGSVS
jgi:hypothetical protein